MAIMLAMTMVGQPVSAYAEDFVSEVGSAEDELELEDDFSDSDAQKETPESETTAPEESEDNTNSGDTEISDEDGAEVIIDDETTEYESEVNIFSDDTEEPVDAVGAEITNSGKCGDDLTWTLDADGVLKIDGTGAMYDYAYSSATGEVAPWRNLEIKSLVMGENTYKIGKYAFWGCKTLCDVDISRISTIGDYAFTNCTGLKNINAPRLYHIGTGAFSNCTGLTEISSSYNLAEVGNRAFYQCSNLTTVNMFVGTIGQEAFYQDKKLSSITFGNRLYYIGKKAFEYCEGLEKLDFSKIEACLTIDDYAFAYTNKLEKILFPNALGTIGKGAFLGCGVYEITIPGKVREIQENAFSTASVARPKCRQYVFDGDYPENGIAKTAIEAGIIFYNNDNETWADKQENFYDKVFLRSEKPVITEEIVDVSYVSDGLSVVGADGTMAEYGRVAVGFSASNKGLYDRKIKQVIFVDTPEYITSFAFQGCDQLESLEIPEGVTCLDSYAFYQCEGLKTIQLPESLTTIETSAFKDCPNLAEINIPSQITSISESVFEKCRSLESITLGNNIQSIEANAFAESGINTFVLPENLKEIGANAFIYSALKTVFFRNEVPVVGENAFQHIDNTRFYYPVNGNWTEDNRNSDVFEKNNNCEWISYDKGVLGEYHYNNDATCISDGTETAECICGCGWSDTRVVKGSKDSNAHSYTQEYEEQPDGSIIYCCKYCGKPQMQAEMTGKCGDFLEWELYDSKRLFITGTGDMYDYDIDNPAPWNGKPIQYCRIDEGVTSIGASAFEGCNALTNVSMKEGLTDIKGYAFYQCTSLKEVKLPESVTSVGDAAFEGCTSLEKLTAYEKLTSIQSNSFRKCNLLTVYGYTGSEIYKHARERKIAFESLGYWGTCGKTADWLLLGDELTIRGTGDIMDYTSQEKAPWAELEVKHCAVKDGILSIGNYAFAGMTGLEDIDLTQGLTSIGEYAFEGCTGLKEAELPGGVMEISDGMFKGCTSLQVVKCSENLTSLGQEAFKDCSGLSTFAIPEGITEIKESTFEGCSLTEIQFPSALLSIADNAFVKNKFTEVQIPASVTKISSTAFSGCEQLQNYIVDDANTEYSSSGGILYDKEGTSLISCPGGREGSFTVPRRVKYIAGNAFKDCRKITELILPSSLISIGMNAFENMILETIEIPANVQFVSRDIFKGCLQLTNITVDSDNENFTAVNGILCNKTKKTIEACPPGMKEVILWEGVKEISRGAFSGMVEGSIIDIPFSLRTLYENDFGTTSVIRIYDNAIIRRYMVNKGYNLESKGNYPLS